MKTMKAIITTGIFLASAAAFAQASGQATGGGDNSTPEALSGQNPSTGGSMTGPGQSGTASRDSNGKLRKSGKHTNTGKGNSNSGGAMPSGTGTSNQDTPAHGSH